MNGSLKSIKSMCASLYQISRVKKNIDVVVCVPAPYFDYVSQNLHNVALGAQNVSQYDQGAFTGEISVHMLKDFNCQYVLVGHSERRNVFQENNASIAQKVQKVLENGLMPIICIGETLEQRLSGNLNNVLLQQIEYLIYNRITQTHWNNIIIAYEPIWAIGTRHPATSIQIQQIHTFIRQSIEQINENFAKSIRIVYGGSVTSENASKILSLQDVDGGLIGEASLDEREFVKIFNNLC